ncbi:uncharacterized protein B0T15DRAFT_197836 [Chaetomium strumarium]|uniref:Uncharacterized protein n=1 Tax=Chaetomium strumarium TaxID=1170767 RepID=A0AAJ0M1F8_9PEZI|nr:hypothetical protein B0T15DRAFT_197836 [Chaetomium strumarium]
MVAVSIHINTPFRPLRCSCLLCLSPNYARLPPAPSTTATRALSPVPASAQNDLASQLRHCPRSVRQPSLLSFSFSLALLREESLLNGLYGLVSLFERSTIPFRRCSWVGLLQASQGRPEPPWWTWHCGCPSQLSQPRPGRAQVFRLPLLWWLLQQEGIAWRMVAFELHHGRLIRTPFSCCVNTGVVLVSSSWRLRIDGITGQIETSNGGVGSWAFLFGFAGRYLDAIILWVAVCPVST